jgi:hypothetical protein
MPPAIRAMLWRMRAVENAAVAAVMNELFVNIKVDREERLDIDNFCMSARHYFGRAKPGARASIGSTARPTRIWCR